jgi:hypothetical protein
VTQAARFAPSIGGFIPAKPSRPVLIEREPESTTDQSAGWMP